MQIKSTYLKKIILEGCNGEWAQERYLPVLIKKAAGGEIQLWAVDIGNSIELSTPEIEEDWQIAQSKNRACYLNKSTDTQNYQALSNADCVFVVAPDQFHSEIARHWLERLAPEGKIFIEKPLDASLGSALKLKEKIEEKGKEIIFGFDHYLANAHLFLRNKASYLGEIGEIRKIEFHILEPDGISPEREETLGKGMIFDLFCHILALVYAVVDQNSTCSETRLKSIKLEEVKAARYVGSPISGETFAWIKAFVNRDIEVISAVGKCVGTSEDKFMKLYGLEGNIKLDFVDDEFSVFDSQGRRIKQGRLNSKHVESFLEEVLQGKEPLLMLPGTLSFDAALGILKILDKAKQQIGKMPLYQYNDSIDKILEILGERELR